MPTIQPSPHSDGIDLSEIEINEMQAQVDSGSIAASITLLHLLRQGIDDESIEVAGFAVGGVDLTDAITEAIENIIAWFGDEHVSAITAAITEIKFAGIATSNS